MTQRPTAFVNARLVDPASGWDGPGALLVQDGKIADVAQGRLSVVLPIGTAILGYAKGDTITWQTPGGPRQIQIAAIPYQPEAAGDYHL